LPELSLGSVVVRTVSRRGLLARAGRLLLAVAGGGAVAAAVRAQAAEAYHFCGHVYTTGSCPHPSGLPRVDEHGMPLRAADGHPVDDLGRPVNALGEPVDAEGRVLRAPDGEPLPTAPRTPVCDGAAERYGFRPYVDGAWYRCCGGHVRKLIDCCGFVTRRVNGDAALIGYCSSGRRVFCVVYYDTKIPC
jgi:hypothetical protein